ncbi:DUF6093 family protein [Actinacidiphila sp. ITFR-21]|uniref:DUF6093 family protein n=1 Tax=Actinacidiphila sp. ITFR-21 TaxID=3075199 RepID=UPI00288B4DDD|nr:DUF6093 family protein [Streptomyces sp. ITFR-21]WNI16618.1 DUF6093 family protein [Streptomyces sp. ITFR-21]
MSAAGAAASGRVAAEQQMTDRCVIARTGPVRTAEDGTDTRPAVQLYEGICRVKPASTAAVVPSTTAPAETWQYKLSIPYASGAGIASNDAVVITASQDPTLIGLHLQVRNIDRGTHITARRFWCTEVSR